MYNALHFAGQCELSSKHSRCGLRPHGACRLKRNVFRVWKGEARVQWDLYTLTAQSREEDSKDGELWTPQRMGRQVIGHLDPLREF